MCRDRANVAILGAPGAGCQYWGALLTTKTRNIGREPRSGQRSEGGPGLPSISTALEAPCTGLGGGPADEGTRGQRFVDASDETISKSAASTKNVIDRLLRLPHRASERVFGSGCAAVTIHHDLTWVRTDALQARCFVGQTCLPLYNSILRSAAVARLHGRRPARFYVNK